MDIGLDGGRVVIRRFAVDDSIEDSKMGRVHPGKRDLSYKQMQDCLDPSKWNQEMREAWNNAMPDIDRAFDVLRGAVR